MRIDSARGYFEALATRGREPRLRECTGAWQLDIEGAGSWSIEVDHGVLQVTEGSHASPTARLRFDEQAFVRIAGGEGRDNLITAALKA